MNETPNNSDPQQVQDNINPQQPSAQQPMTNSQQTIELPPTAAPGATVQQSVATPAETIQQPVVAPATTPVVESASATTSADNKNSGYTAFIITGITLVVICLLSWSIGGCVSSVISTAANQYADSEYDSYGYGYGYGSDNGFDSSNGYGSSKTTGSEALNVDDVLQMTSLDISGDGISDLIYSAEYAGSQAAVSDYVKKISDSDKQSTDDLIKHWRAAAAATDEATRTAELKAAADTAAAAQDSISGLTPLQASDVTGSNASNVADALSSGQSSAVTRWKDISTELDMLLNPSGHTNNDLTSTDDDVYYDTYEASSYLIEALAYSASE